MTFDLTSAREVIKTVMATDAFQDLAPEKNIVCQADAYRRVCRRIIELTPGEAMAEVREFVLRRLARDAFESFRAPVELPHGFAGRRERLADGNGGGWITRIPPPA